MSDYTLKINATGIDPKLLKVTFVDNILKVQRTDKPSHVRIEPICQPGRYDLKAAKASYQYGLLTVTIPEKKAVELDIPITVDWS
jgi:HSP20 family molecular chaperone IbpA